MPNPRINRLVERDNPPGYLDLNFAALPNGPVPGMLGSTWDVASGVARNNATIEPTELITNGDFETWGSSTDLTGVTEVIAGASTITQDTTNMRNGSSCMLMTGDGSNSNVAARNDSSIAANRMVYTTVYAKLISGANKAYRFIEANTASIGFADAGVGAYAIGHQSSFTLASAMRGVRSVTMTSSAVAFDDLSSKFMTTNTLFSVRKFLSIYGSGKAAFTMAANSSCYHGIVMCADYPYFNNFVVTYRDKNNAIRMDKCVNGTMFSVMGETGKTYVAGQNVMMKRLPGTTTFQAFYGAAGSETQVGADKTITDVSIINNKYHGLFDASPQLNTCSRFIYSVGG